MNEKVLIYFQNQCSGHVYLTLIIPVLNKTVYI